MADAPGTTRCQLEVWTGASWFLAHAGVPLLHPERYVERLAGNGKVGRVTILETREVIQTHCQFCTESHPAPFTGECLLL